MRRIPDHGSGVVRAARAARVYFVGTREPALARSSKGPECGGDWDGPVHYWAGVVPLARMHARSGSGHTRGMLRQGAGGRGPRRAFSKGAAQARPIGQWLGECP